MNVAAVQLRRARPCCGADQDPGSSGRAEAEPDDIGQEIAGHPGPGQRAAHHLRGSRRGQGDGNASPALLYS